VLPTPLVTAAATVGAGVLAGLAMSPLGWVKLIAELAYGA